MLNYCQFFLLITSLIQCATSQKPQVLDWDFCDSKYDNTVQGHTYKHVCCHPEKERKANCETVTESIDDFRKAILAKTNQQRDQTAKGEFNGQRPGSNINALSYDLNLEYVAWCNAIRCEFKHDKDHYMHALYGGVGQNLAITMKYEKMKDPTQVMVDLTQNWYNEKNDLVNHQEVLDNFPSVIVDGKTIGHYTCTVWWCVTHIGCARTFWNDGKFWNYYLVCVYGGPNSMNLIGTPVYKKGTPCTECQDGKKCNTQYTSLCGDIAPIPTGWTPERDVPGGPAGAQAGNGSSCGVSLHQLRISNSLVLLILLFVFACHVMMRII